MDIFQLIGFSILLLILLYHSYYLFLKNNSSINRLNSNLNSNSN
jgi:hypothetical protein